ncbi:MAG TPA: hypothetical protein VGJ78_23905 [Vicinamibacterales bacterium]|jgi:hypothetical protein
MDPLADAAPLDKEEAELADCARTGSPEVLEFLITRHARWIYDKASHDPPPG